MKKNSVLLMIVVLITLFSGCTTGSGTVKNASELNTPTKMSMLYDKFSGYKETHIEVKENEPVIVTVNIVTEKGSIDTYIKNNDTNNSAYQGRAIPTSSFTVTLFEQGNYTIRVDAKDHTGSFTFSWGK